jgi:transposase
MFLTAYKGVSDRKLIEQLNGNIDYQLFCGILLKPGERFVDNKIVSKIRTSLGHKLNIKQSEKILAGYWKPTLQIPM